MFKFSFFMKPSQIHVPSCGCLVTFIINHWVNQPVQSNKCNIQRKTFDTNMHNKSAGCTGVLEKLSLD